jgi:hypothetical protein
VLTLKLQLSLSLCVNVTVRFLLDALLLLLQLKRGRGSNSMFRSQPLDQLFSMDDFLADVEASVRPFLERLTTTQVLS